MINCLLSLFSRIAWEVFARVSAFSFLCLSFSLVNAQSQLLKDINVEQELTYDEFSALCPASGIMYVSSRNHELWKTTGSAGGTVRLRTFESLQHLFSIGSTAYFVANDRKSGAELWKSNGTSSTTVMVKDITAGSAGTNIHSLTAIGQTLVFVAQTNLGQELWRSDGTLAGTYLIKDIFPRGGGSNPVGLVLMGSHLYFSANDGVNGIELWRTDGTAGGTTMVKDIRTGSRVSSQPAEFAVVGNTVYFTANTDIGRELWKSDGTSTGTVLVKDIRLGSGSSSPKNLTNVNGVLFFSASDGVFGHELWKSDGTPNGTMIVKDITPGSSGSNSIEYFGIDMTYFTALAGRLYFVANERGRAKLFVSNGTASGTMAIQNLYRVGWGYSNPAFTLLNSNVYFFNADEGEGYFLYRIGSTGTTPAMVRPFELPLDRYAVDLSQLMTVFNNSLYMTGIVGNDYQLFKSNGTAAGTAPLKDFYKTTMPSEPEFFASFNNFSFFTANEGTESSYSACPCGIWRTDGTPTGTVRLIESLSDFTPVGTVNGFTYAVEGYYPATLWKTNGTIEGTSKVASMDGFGIQTSAVAGNLIYMISYLNKVWRSDGTPAGTFELTVPGRIFETMVLNQSLFFITEVDGRIELWKTNGTVATTAMVKVISTSDYRGNYATQKYAALNGVLYFAFNDRVSGTEVWRTDGSAAGTYIFGDLNATGNDFDDIAALHVHEGVLHVSAMGDDGLWGIYKTRGTTQLQREFTFFPVTKMISLENKLLLFAKNEHTTRPTSMVWLWSSDGSEAGTSQISDDQLNSDFSYVVHRGHVYFTTGYFGNRVYRSNGTRCGTFQLDLGIPGTRYISVANSRLIFNGIGARVGNEPHAMALSTTVAPPCNEATELFTTAQTDAEVKMWPNPFTQNFSIDTDEMKNVQAIEVYSFDGVPVESITIFNSETKFGEEWKPGVYLVKFYSDKGAEVKMVVKK